MRVPRTAHSYSEPSPQIEVQHRAARVPLTPAHSRARPLPLRGRGFDTPSPTVTGLRYAYPDAVALDGIDARIEPGIITGLVGPDGAGKTTLLRLIAGLLRPTAGTVHVLGHDMATDAAAVHPSIGYMPQAFGLYEDLSVAENLDLFADLHAMPRDMRRAYRAAAALHRPGAIHHAPRRASCPAG